MRKFWPLLILLTPGCTFFTFKDGQGPGPRSVKDMQDVNPGLYIVLAVFVLILLLSVFVGLFKDENPNTRGRDDKGVAMMMAFMAAVVVLLLVG